MSLKNDFKDFAERIIRDKAYGKTDGICPKCGSPLYKNMCISFLSYPIQKEYACYDCDYKEVGLDGKYTVIDNWYKDLIKTVKEVQNQRANSEL